MKSKNWNSKIKNLSRRMYQKNTNMILEVF